HGGLGGFPVSRQHRLEIHCAPRTLVARRRWFALAWWGEAEYAAQLHLRLVPGDRIATGGAVIGGLGDLPLGLLTQQPALTEQELGFAVVQILAAQPNRVGDQLIVALAVGDLGGVGVARRLPERLTDLDAVGAADTVEQ